MPQKNAAPSQAQQAVIRKHGLNPFSYAVVKELPGSLIVRNRDTGEFKVLNKEPSPGSNT